MTDSVINNGTVAWQADSGGVAFNRGTIVNKGVWDTQGDAALAFAGGTANSFTNDGVFQKSGGSGTTSLTNSDGLASSTTARWMCRSAPSSCPAQSATPAR